MPREATSDLIRAVHDTVRGRIRFEVAGLYRSADLARALVRHLEQVAGVRSVKASALTGRVLIVYRPSRTTPHALIDAVLTLVRARAGGRRLAPSAPKRPPRPASRPVAAACNSSAPMLHKDLSGGQRQRHRSARRQIEVSRWAAPAALRE